MRELQQVSMIMELTRQMMESITLKKQNGRLLLRGQKIMVLLLFTDLVRYVKITRIDVHGLKQNFRLYNFAFFSIGTGQKLQILG